MNSSSIHIPVVSSPNVPLQWILAESSDTTQQGLPSIIIHVLSYC